MKRYAHQNKIKNSLQKDPLQTDQSVPAWLRPVENIVFILLVLANIAPFLFFTFFPSQDGPAHIYNAVTLHDYLLLSEGINHLYYELNPSINANWVTHLILVVLVHFIKPLVAEKIILIAYVLLFAIAVRYALASFGPGARSFAVLIFPFIGNWALHMGFYNFSYSLVLYFLVLGIFLRSAEKRSGMNVIMLALAATFLNFLHLLTFTIALISTLCMAIWYGLLHWWKRKKSGSYHSKLLEPQHVLRPLGLVAICFAPGIIIQALWIFKSAPVRYFDWLDLDKRWFIFTRMSTLAVYMEKEYLWTCALLILFGLLTAAGIAMRRRDPSLRPSDGLLLLAIGLFVGFFLLPNTAFGANMLTFRLILFPFFALILWIGAQIWPQSVRLAVQAVVAVIALALLLLHFKCYAHLNEYLTEYTSVAERIEPGHTILPLTLSGTAPLLEPNRIPYPIRPFLHASGYVAATRRGVYLNNYEALTDHFPLHFRPEVNPHSWIGAVGYIPPNVQFLDYDKRTPGSVDYIAYWKIGPWIPTHREDAIAYQEIISHWRKQLNSGYELVAASEHGHMKLYRARPKL